MNKRILITAHAGCLDEGLDSMEYIQEALKYDVDIIEVDVRFNEKGIAVLSHDKREDYSKCVQLKEVFRLIEETDNVMINLDMKERTHIVNLIEEIKESDMVGRAVITGDDLDKEDVDLLIKEVNVYCCTNGDIDVSRLDEVEYCKGVVKDVIYRKSIGLNLNYIDVTEEIVKELHKNNKKMYVWTVDDYEAILKMKELNVDSITTNRVNWVCKKREE